MSNQATGKKTKFLNGVLEPLGFCVKEQWAESGKFDGWTIDRKYSNRLLSTLHFFDESVGAVGVDLDYITRHTQTKEILTMLKSLTDAIEESFSRSVSITDSVNPR